MTLEIWKPTRGAIAAALLVIASGSAPTVVCAQSGASRHGEHQARSGASVGQSPQRIRTSFDMSPSRARTGASRANVPQSSSAAPPAAQPMTRQPEPVTHQAETFHQDPPPRSRVRVLGAESPRAASSVRQSRSEERRSRREAEQVQPVAAPMQSYVRYDSSSHSEWDFSLAPPPGAIVCGGLPPGTESFSHNRTRYYANMGSCLTRAYQGGMVCYQVVPCPPR
jgi:hypothetical protein